MVVLSAVRAVRGGETGNIITPPGSHPDSVSSNLNIEELAGWSPVTANKVTVMRTST